jgi:hypothetical protein
VRLTRSRSEQASRHKASQRPFRIPAATATPCENLDINAAPLVLDPA